MTRAAGDRCIGCRAPVETLVDFGPQPPSNRFTPPGQADSDRHRLTVGQCTACALLQLVDPMPAQMVRSRFPWLTYNEPEGHLDALTERLTRLPGIGAGSVVAGLTNKDDSSLERLRQRGYMNILRIDPAADLG